MTSLTTLKLTKVKGPSGQEIELQGPDEAGYYRSTVRQYDKQYTFTNHSDLQDLDRLVFAETMVFRATKALASGRTNEGLLLGGADESDARRSIKDAAQVISAIKNDLGMNKSARDREQYESVGKYIADLKARAKETGIHREKQLAKALALTHELFSLVGTFDRSNAIERDKLGLSSEADLIAWVRDVMEPEFSALDKHFRENQQRAWIRRL